MAKIHQPVFAQTPKTYTAVATSAVTNLDSDTPGGVVELAAFPDAVSGGDGAIITNLTAMPRATVTATALHLFLSKDEGATMRIIRSVLLGAHTVEATTAIPVVDFEFTETAPLRLEAGDSIYVGTGIAAAGGVAFSAQATEY